MRVPPLPADQWDDAVDHALVRDAARRAPQPGEREQHRSAPSSRHPKLTQAFLRFNVHLLFSSTLPPRLRELAILRVAHRRDSEYEWTQHVKMGLRRGSPTEAIDGVQRGEAADEFDRAVLAAVDELSRTSRTVGRDVGRAGRAPRRAPADGPRLHGRLLRHRAMAFNTFGVEPEQER